MKVADSPEIAVRFGSANVRTTPALSIARSVAVTEGVAPNDVARLLPGTSGPLFAVNGVELLKFTTAVPYVMLALRSMPICLMIERWTSATVTFSITWSRPRTVIELTTLSAPPTSRAARSAACCASIGLAAEPVRITPSPRPSIWISALGSVCLQRGAHAVEVALDRDVVGGDLLARGIEEYDVGLADRGADDVGALRRTHHGVGDLGIGDQHILDVARQVDHDRLADAERQEARVHLAVGGNGRRDAIVARHHGRQRRIERQRCDGRKRQGADQKGPHRRLISPAFHIARPFGHFCVVVWLETP